MQEEIRIALPSKGHLGDDTLRFLEGCGLRVNKRNPRQYIATIPALPDVLVLFQRPRDIPMSVAAGDVDLGITGLDALTEMVPDHAETVVQIHEALGYGECALVLAVPEVWDDVRTVADLRARAAQTPGDALRVATKFQNSVTRYLAANAVENVRVVQADGALESAPIVGYADFIADITSSGTTLRENRLRALDDGEIVRSQAVLIGNRAALASRPALLETTRQMLEFIEAHLRAQGQYMIFANMRGESAEAVAEQIFSQPELGGLQGPTIAPMVTRDGGSNWWAINLVTSAAKLYATIRQVRAVGGSGVVVTPITYIFEEAPTRYQRLVSELESEA
jgi:ATP phosphoribosyltransferase